MIFFVKKDESKNFLWFLYYQFLNLWYLKHIFDIHLKEKNINSYTTLPKKINNHIIFYLKKKHHKGFNIKYFNEIVFLFIINVWLKNVKNICKYIQTRLNSVHFKKHRRYFLFFFKIFKKYVVPYFSKLNLKGVYLRFKGKLGRGGNSRKKTMVFKRGSYALTNKNLPINLQKWDVWTKTGSVGCTLQLFY